MTREFFPGFWRRPFSDRHTIGVTDLIKDGYTCADLFGNMDVTVVDPTVKDKYLFTIQEKPTDLPPLKRAKFSHTDTEFHPNLPAYNSFCLFLGPPGSRKTSTITGMLLTDGVLKKKYNKIWLFNPFPESMNGVLPIHPDRQFREFTLDNLQHILDTASEDNLHHLVIFDDVLGQIERNNKEFQKFVWNRRNISGDKSDRKKDEKSGSITIFVTAQNLRRMPALFRDCVTEIFAWKVDGRTLTGLNEEFLCDMDPVLRAKIRDICWKEPHDFMYIKRKRGPRGFYRVFHNFNELDIGEIHDDLKEDGLL